MKIDDGLVRRVVRGIGFLAIIGTVCYRAIENSEGAIKTVEMAVAFMLGFYYPKDHTKSKGTGVE